MNLQKGSPIQNPFLDENDKWKSSYQIDYSLIEMIVKLHHFNSDDIEESLYFLHQNRMIKDHAKTFKTNGDPIDIFNDILSEKGSEFIKFIIEPQV